MAESTTPNPAVLDEIGALAARFPVPHPSWHGYVPEMHDCLADLAGALEAARVDPDVGALLERALAGELEQPFDATAAEFLTEAYDRLGRLPVPAGEHPYLDEIVPTLEAMEALLVCISLVPAAAQFLRELPE